MNQSPQAVENVPIPTPETPRRFHFSYVLIIGLILPVIIIGAYLLGKQNSQPEPVACTMDAQICPDGSSVGRMPPNCEFAPCPVTQPTPTIDMSDWKTYVNEKKGIEYKYPDNWSIQKKPLDSKDGLIDKISFLNEENKNIGLTFSTYQNSPKYGDSIESYYQYYEKVSKDSLSNQPKVAPLYVVLNKQYQVNNLDITLNIGELTITSMGDADIDIIAIPLLQKDIIFEFWITSAAVSNSETIERIKTYINQIISTIKFTDQTPSSNSISSWKTYTNNQFGFTFKYPDNWQLTSKAYEKEGIISMDSYGGTFSLSMSPKKQSAGFKDLTDDEYIEKSTQGLFSTSGLADFGPLQTDKRKVKLNNIEGIMYTFNFSKPQYLTYDQLKYFYAINTNRVLWSTFRNTTDGKTDQLFNQILSTFKFTN